MHSRAIRKSTIPDVPQHFAFSQISRGLIDFIKHLVPLGPKGCFKSLSEFSAPPGKNLGIALFQLKCPLLAVTLNQHSLSCEFVNHT